jgi:hypothetical protein
MFFIFKLYTQIGVCSQLPARKRAADFTFSLFEFVFLILSTITWNFLIHYVQPTYDQALAVGMK